MLRTELMFGMMMQPLLFLTLIHASVALAFSPGSQDASFSLSAYQKARAQKTSNSLDASRYHFQILFVDNDNFHGRIAEGMLARVAEYNDALFTLFPASATIESSPKAPVDSAAPDEALAVCESLGLCPTSCSQYGTAFDLAYLNDYDLIVAMDDDIQSLILRSLPPESGYENRCCLLSEFLSADFYGFQSRGNMIEQDLQDMLEPEFWERAKPFYEVAKGSSSSLFAGSATAWNDIYQPRIILSKSGAAVPNTNGWPMVEAAMLVACAGVTRFCLDTMDVQFDKAFQNLLEQHFYRPEHYADCSVEQADAQLRKGSNSVTGYFSPKERHARIKQHLENLRSKMN